MSILKNLLTGNRNGKGYETSDYRAADGQNVKVCAKCGRSAQVLVCGGKQYCKWCGK